jgi:hypothetical protein
MFCDVLEIQVVLYLPVWSLPATSRISVCVVFNHNAHNLKILFFFIFYKSSFPIIAIILLFPRWSYVYVVT